MSDGIGAPYFKGFLPPALEIRFVYTCGNFVYGEVEEGLLSHETSGHAVLMNTFPAGTATDVFAAQYHSR